jgi:chromosome segregation ATPase
MKQMPQLKKILIPAAAVVVGLVVGLGIGQFQIKKEQKIFQEKIKESNKRMTYLQKKMADEKNETTAAMEGRYQAELKKIQDEKSALGGQLGKLKEQTGSLEKKIKESDENTAKTRKEIQDVNQKYAQAAQHGKDLERDLKKVKGEKEALQGELKAATRSLNECEKHNASLCIIAEDLVKAYRNKGVGAAILEKDPLLQIKKVDLEHLTRKYREEIEQQRIKKK